MKTVILFLVFISWNTSIPNLNSKVIEYVDSVIGKQVDRGECWDLAAAALDHAGAYMDKSNFKNINVFGKVLNPEKDAIYPGDIIQIEKVKMEYTKGNSVYTETMPHHTAIIYKVLEKNYFEIAHQNTSFSGRKVGISELNMDHVKKGKIIFYRPYKK
jgi:hypothetical protein